MITPANDRRDRKDERVNAAMAMLLRYRDPTPVTGFLARVPWAKRFYIDMFLACGKLGGLREPTSLVQNCIVMARKGAAFHGDTYRGRELKSLGESFQRYPEEAAAYVREWDTANTRQNRGAK